MFSQTVDTVILPPRADERGITYHVYPGFFNRGDILNRSQVAERAGRSYSTVTYHLERAVSAGLLNKQYGFPADCTQPAWLYALPEDMPRLEGLR